MRRVFKGCARFIAGVVILLGAPVAAAPAAKPLPIVLAHPEPQAPAWLRTLVERFNASGNRVMVTLAPDRPGGAGPAALHLLGPADRLAAGDELFRPLYQLSGQRARARWSLAPSLAASVSDRRGRLLAVPLAYGAPVLFINQDSLATAGFGVTPALRTWAEVQQVAGRLADSGAFCPVVAASPAVTLIEQVSTLQGSPIVASGDRAVFNGLLQVKHLALMSSWVKSGLLRPLGRQTEATDWFARGDCAMLVGDSSALAQLGGLPVEVRPLPLHDDYRGKTAPVQPDGAALWVSAKALGGELSTAAAFIDFVFSAEAQTLLTSAGFLPLATTTSPLPETVRVALAASRGATGAVYVTRHPRWQRAVDDALAAVWSGRESAKQALDDAVAEVSGNRPRLARLGGENP
jgi:sn-glycerol 3-phosphate transport system substrate-binding protein